MAKKQWRCFHCDEVFFSARWAREHFGADEGAVPACKIASHEGHLIAYIRKLEDDLAQYRTEDSHVLRAMWSLEADHRQALTREEEKGYARGIRDVTAQWQQAIRSAPSLDENGYICEKAAIFKTYDPQMIWPAPSSTPTSQQQGTDNA